MINWRWNRYALLLVAIWISPMLVGAFCNRLRAETPNFKPLVPNFKPLVRKVVSQSAATFRQRDPHACPNCGRLQFVISGFNRDGTHTHVCPDPGCRTAWRH